MSGNIWRYDCYDLRKFRPLDIDYFIDIGANFGSTSLQAKVLNSKARVISLEPTIKTFNILANNMKQWRNTGIECYNVSLGDGNEMCVHERYGDGGNNRCYSNNEKHWWPGDSYMLRGEELHQYMVESKTLEQIFLDYSVDENKNYIIKCDCEGGERFLIQSEFEEQSLKYIRGSVQTMFELHYPFGGTFDEWNIFIEKLKDTHELRIGGWKDKKTPYKRYEYNCCDSILAKEGKIQIELISKEWVIKGY